MTTAELIEKLERAERLLGLARAALDPFASVAEWDIGENEDWDDTFRPMTGGHNYAPLLKVGDLRQARDVFDHIESALKAKEADNGKSC